MISSIHYKIKDLSRTAKAILNQVKSKNILSGYTDIIGNLKTDTTGRIKHTPTAQNQVRTDDKNSTIKII